jgi:hypothetical protein
VFVNYIFLLSKVINLVNATNLWTEGKTGKERNVFYGPVFQHELYTFLCKARGSCVLYGYIATDGHKTLTLLLPLKWDNG